LLAVPLPPYPKGGNRGDQYNDLANAITGAVYLASQDFNQDGQGIAVIKRHSVADGPILGDGFADFFILKKSADDWLHDR